MEKLVQYVYMRGKTLAGAAELLGGKTEKNKMVYVKIGAPPDCEDSSTG
jgi:hypothetical protein